MAYKINDVKEYLLKNDLNNECELLSTEYINATTPLLFKCNLCGEVFERDFNHLRQNRFRCIKCSHKIQGQIRSTKHKYSSEDIQKEIATDGYTLIGEYKNCSTAVLCQCSHGHYFNFNYKNYQAGQSRCPYCRQINTLQNKDPNNIKTNHITFKQFLRDQLKSWKNECIKKSNHISDISGKYENNVDVHHLINFTDIMTDTLKELNLPLKDNYTDYTPQEILKIIALFQEKHTTNIGVVLSQKEHQLFHKIYGHTNNTIEQYNKFKYVMQNNLL